MAYCGGGAWQPAFAWHNGDETVNGVTEAQQQRVEKVLLDAGADRLLWSKKLQARMTVHSSSYVVVANDGTAPFAVICIKATMAQLGDSVEMDRLIYEGDLPNIAVLSKILLARKREAATGVRAQKLYFMFSESGLFTQATIKGVYLKFADYWLEKVGCSKMSSGHGVATVRGYLTCDNLAAQVVKELVFTLLSYNIVLIRHVPQLSFLVQV